MKREQNVIPLEYLTVKNGIWKRITHVIVESSDSFIQKFSNLANDFFTKMKTKRKKKEKKERKTPIVIIRREFDFRFNFVL